MKMKRELRRYPAGVGWWYPGKTALLVATILGGVTLCGVTAFGAGTTAGTVIVNNASLVYTIQGSSRTLESNRISFVVDDKLSFVLVASDVANVAITAGGKGFMTYTLTNTGNAAHDFTMNAVVTGIPTLIPSAGPIFYADAAGVTPLPNDQAVGGLSFIGNLSPDSVKTFYLFITAPVHLVNGQTIAYLLTAEAYQPVTLGQALPPVKSSSVAAIEAAMDKNAHPLTRFVILADGHGNGGDADRDGKYTLIAKDGVATLGFKALSTAVSIVKSSVVTDRVGGSLPMPGSTLRYTLSVAAVGTGNALGVLVTDRVPLDTVYTAGTLSLNGKGLSDAVDGDAGDVGGTTPGVVTVFLGNLPAASPVQTIEFEVKIK
jgi:uncharacterized repeat protein (TIGR01451 family)